MALSSKRDAKQLRNVSRTRSLGVATSEPKPKDPPTSSPRTSRKDKKSGLFDFSHQVGHLLRKAYQRHTAIFQETCPDPQLTSVQFAALCAIDILGQASLREIGRTAALDPATARGVVDRLSDRGFVILAADPSDRRKVVVQLKPEGRQMIQSMKAPAAQISESTMQGLSNAERVALIYLLRHISGSLGSDAS